MAAKDDGQGVDGSHSPQQHVDGRSSVLADDPVPPGSAVRKPRTRHPRPGLRDLVDAARNGPPSRESLGPRRAIVQCHHPGGARHRIAEVRGDVILVDGMPGTAVVGQVHGLSAAYAVHAPCSHCPPGQQDRVLDLPAVRLALRQSSGGSPLKLNADVVAPRTPTPPAGASAAQARVPRRRRRAEDASEAT